MGDENANDEHKKKEPLTRVESFQKLNDEPIELPLVSIVTLEPQAMEMAGRLVKILNDPILFEKFKQMIHKKFDLTIHRIDKEIKGSKPAAAPTAVAAGGGAAEESYFTQEECSFFSNNQEI
jgi:hypothetical protein